MKKIILILAFCLLPSLAFAQCNGIFPSQTVCGSAAGGVPGPLPTSSFALAPGGSSNQIQYNNGAGGLGGFTASGDATVNVSTGVVTVTKTGGVAFAPSATTDTTNAGNISSGSLSDARLSSNVPLKNSTNAFTGLNTYSGDVRFGDGRPWCDIMARGAVGNSATVDTAAVNACITTLSALGGGIMFIPPNTNCYLINAINGTTANSITIQGVGNSSCLTINSIDAASNWFDLSGSNGWGFDNIRINDNGTTIAKVAILWACTGTSCGTSGVLHDLYFNRVSISINTTAAILYGYGFGSVNPGTTPGHGSLSINNSTFVELHDGPSGGPFSNANAPLHLTATNDLSITSANQTVTTDTAYGQGATITNSDFIDKIATNSHNAAMVLFNEYVFTMTGGSIKCNSCSIALIIASNGQGFGFYGVNFTEAQGGAAGPSYWVGFVDGLNTFITIDAPFFSSPNIATIFMGPPQGSGLGGVWYLQVRGTNNAGTFGSQGFIFTGTTCTGYGAASQNWIQNSYLQLYAGGSAATITTGCGGIDAHTILQGAVTVTVPSGATDSSHHF